MPLTGSSGSSRLGAATPILTGLATARNHGGAASLEGKILRMTPTGAVPRDNPTTGSPLYALGHRNSQGIVDGIGSKSGFVDPLYQ